MVDLILPELERSLAASSLRGQWQSDADRPENSGTNSEGNLFVQPRPGGEGHVWRWKELEPFFDRACRALQESRTARRALVMSNPGLARGTTKTLLASMQIVRPGEVAWAHRHVINALRFSIMGSEKLFTVVDGRKLKMEPYDLILTPSWAWHDHHNESNGVAIWLDVLDVPVTLALNQQFYEEFGEVAQPTKGADIGDPVYRKDESGPGGASMRPYRYPWAEMSRYIEQQHPVDPHAGVVAYYINPVTGGSVLPTISCRIQVLPPGFAGKVKRTTASEIAFVVEGEGSVSIDGEDFAWHRHDSLALPNWSKKRFSNGSQTDRAVLFVVSDEPLLEAVGFLRVETC